MNEKDTAVKFLNMVVAGKIDEAYDKYVNENGKHHNVYFPAGFYSLMDAMKLNHKEFPDKLLEIKNIIAEDNLVATHSKIIIGEKEIAVVHLFRFEDGKIIEMWDVGQEVPKELPNIDGAF